MKRILFLLFTFPLFGIIREQTLPVGTQQAVLSWNDGNEVPVNGLIFIKPDNEPVYKRVAVIDCDALTRFTYYCRNIPFSVYIQNARDGLRSDPSDTIHVTFGVYTPPPVTPDDSSDFYPLPDLWTGKAIYDSLDHRGTMNRVGTDLIMNTGSFIFTMFRPIPGYLHEISILGTGKFRSVVGTGKEVTSGIGKPCDFINTHIYLWRFNSDIQWIALFALENGCKLNELHVVNLEVKLDRPVDLKVED